MNRCSICVLPETYPNISFDENGICNFCNTHTNRKLIGIDMLLKGIRKYKNPLSPYDALVGMSGGRDSTYAAYYAVRELGLKVLGFTYDNGFMPKTTWENIHNAVNILGIDHQTIKLTNIKRSTAKVVKALSKKPSPAMTAFLCTGCHSGLTKAQEIIVKQTGCSNVLSGGGEPENSFAEYLLSGTRKRDKNGLIRGFLREILHNPIYLDPVLLFSFFKEFLSIFTRRKLKIHRYFLFLYIDWDEDKIVNTITSELNWKIPEKMSSSWRSDCNINVIKQYLYKETLGFTKNEELLSQLIRKGTISRNMALQRLEHENEIHPDLLAEIFQDLDIPITKLHLGMIKYKKENNIAW